MGNRNSSVQKPKPKPKPKQNERVCSDDVESGPSEYADAPPAYEDVIAGDVKHHEHHFKDRKDGKGVEKSDASSKKHAAAIARPALLRVTDSLPLLVQIAAEVRRSDLSTVMNHEEDWRRSFNAEGRSPSVYRLSLIHI